MNLRRLAIPLACALSLSACKIFNASTTATEADESPMALAPPEKIPLIERAVDELIRQGILRFNPSMSLPPLSRDFLEVIHAGAGYKLGFSWSDAQHIIRRDVFEFQQDLSKSVFSLAGDRLAFPFGISKGETVEFIRVFPNTGEAARALPPSLTALPLTADKALAMGQGDSVIIPVTTRLTAPASFKIQRLAGIGTVSASIRAVLEGSFRLQITRAEQQKIRLRVAESASDGAGLSAAATVGAPLRVSVFQKDFSGGISLDAQKSQGVRFSADYEIDLAAPQARQAFEEAVSGRMLLARTAGVPWNVEQDSFMSLAALETLASAERDGPVLRRAYVLDHFQEAKRRIALSLPFISWGLTSDWERNQLEITDTAGNKEQYLLASYSFSDDKHFPFYNWSHKEMSGFIVPARGGQPAPVPSHYWFAWRQKFTVTQSGSMITTLEKANNLLPKTMPLVPRDEVMADYPPQDDILVWIVLGPRMMEALFDSGRATAGMLAKALGSTAKNMNNRELLPYNQMPFETSTPLPESQDPQVQAGLDAVQHEWGRFYSDYFGKVFLPELAQLQATPDIRRRIAFFERLYSKGLGLNRYGGEVMIRYLTELATVLGLQDDVHASLRLQHKSVQLGVPGIVTQFQLGQARDADVFAYLNSVLGI